MINWLLNALERCIHSTIIFITNFLPVKMIRDENGEPFLLRYHLFTLGYDGPGLCIHHFVKSDPDRGYHDHPWNVGISFILCGWYAERILESDKKTYTTHIRNRWNFNYLDGVNTFHRVMIDEKPRNKVDGAWSLFAFSGRSKVWGMVSLDGEYHPMSFNLSDNDGGWWNTVQKGYGIDHHLDNVGKVIATVDTVVVMDEHEIMGHDSIHSKKVLLIKRGKEPFKGQWAFPGGRIDQKDEDIHAAACRELKEETNLDISNLEYVQTIGNSKRDPRGFCLTNVFLAKLNEMPEQVRAGDDAVNYDWFDITDLPDMAFDHKEILKNMIQRGVV